MSCEPNELQKTAEDLAQRALVAKRRQPLYKQGASLWDTIKDHVSANPLPYVGAGIGAAVGGGSALANKERKKPILSNMLLGGVTGGLTGLAAQEGRKLLERPTPGLGGTMPPATTSPGSAPAAATPTALDQRNAILQSMITERDKPDLSNTLNTGTKWLAGLGYAGTEGHYQAQNLKDWYSNSLGREESRNAIMSGIRQRLTDAKKLGPGMSTGNTQTLGSLLQLGERDPARFQQALKGLSAPAPGFSGLLQRLFGDRTGRHLPQNQVQIPIPGGIGTLQTSQIQELLQEGRAAEAALAAKANPGALGTTSRLLRGAGSKLKAPMGRAAAFGLPVLTMHLLNQSMDRQRAAALGQQLMSQAQSAKTP